VRPSIAEYLDFCATWGVTQAWRRSDTNPAGHTPCRHPASFAASIRGNGVGSCPAPPCARHERLRGSDHSARPELMRWMPPPDAINCAKVVSSEPKRGRHPCQRLAYWRLIWPRTVFRFVR
jgi:hypothetical protein